MQQADAVLVQAIRGHDEVQQSQPSGSQHNDSTAARQCDDPNMCWTYRCLQLSNLCVCVYRTAIEATQHYTVLHISTSAIVKL
eukprot:21237-Heterococcus_DN1.PRE.3